MTPRPLAVGVAGALGLLSALHVTWAFSSWPLSDRSRFAEIIVGTSPDKVPSAAATSAVAGLLACASLLVGRCSAYVPQRLPPRRLAILGTRTVAGVLMARGVAGFVVSGTAFGNTSECGRQGDSSTSSKCRNANRPSRRLRYSATIPGIERRVCHDRFPPMQLSISGSMTSISAPPRVPARAAMPFLGSANSFSTPDLTTCVANAASAVVVSGSPGTATRY